jgi:hypothetical protein
MSATINRGHRGAEAGGGMADDAGSSPQFGNARALERARAALATDFREAIAGGSFPMLAKGGPDAILELIDRSDAHYRKTGRAISVAALLRRAEEENREGLREAVETWHTSDAFQNPEARAARAHRAITTTLQRAKAREERAKAETFQRGAARRETQGEMRARTLAAIERVWKGQDR